VVPYALGTNGSVQIAGTAGTRGQRRFAAFRAILRTRHGHVMERQFADPHEHAIELDGQTRGALAGQPPLQPQFPGNSLGNQLRMVARMIAARGALGAARQVFFVRLGGFDTHADQLSFHPQLLSTLSLCLKAFQDAMVELGTESMVTTFTVSEFGRTLGS